MAGHADLRIAVIGAGIVGIGTGRELLRRGFTNFTVFEKADAVGGTWHLHSYPGLACDVKAHAYTYSYEPNPDWSANYVGQAEIEAYLVRCCTKFGVDPHIRLDTEITAAHYLPDGTWRLRTAAGDEQVFDVVINAMGNQHTPIYPDVPGRDLFRGESWHATHWNHEVDLTGKRVALVGSAASAVQIAPEIAKIAQHLYVLQRTPNWILPRGRVEYTPFRKMLLRRVPYLSALYRGALEKVVNLSHGASVLGNKTMATVESMGRKHIEKCIPDPALRALVTPDTHFGCKRPLVSDDFYPTLVRDDTTLVSAAAKEITEAGVTTEDGQQLEVDVIVYCTGYQVLDFERIDVRGPNDRSLAEVMRQAPEAYKGIAVPGFPNYFLAVGPNGVLLSASYFSAAEANIACIGKLLEQKEAAGARTIEVREELHRKYNDWIHEERIRYSWGSEDCNSYYRTPTGHTPFLFPGDIKTFLRHREEAGLHEYEVA